MELKTSQLDSITPGHPPAGKGPFRKELPPYLVALTAQVAAVLLLAMLARTGTIRLETGSSLMVAAILQGILAAALGHGLGLRPWWIPIHLLFIPAVLGTLSLGLAPGWFLGCFVLLSLIYWSVARTRVPLYLSSGEANRALAGLLPGEPGFRMLDLGAGFGGVLADLQARRPDGCFAGIEVAPLPFAAGWLRNRFTGEKYALQRGNFWSHQLAPYDLIYAYLSPVPMGNLWRKAAAEMRPGSLLVSNTFPIPGVAPDEILQLADFHRSRLYLYRMRGSNESQHEES